MSVKYDEYLKQHRDNVAKAFGWIRDNLPGMLDGMDINELESQICTRHDMSKNDKEEYDAYDRYFYGNGVSNKTMENFDKAWLHHIHNNPHHWQYWVLHNDEEETGTYAIEMPKEYVIEMICDWWAFSWKSGDLTEIFGWWANHEDHIILHKKTHELVGSILFEIKKEVWR